MGLWRTVSNNSGGISVRGLDNRTEEAKPVALGRQLRHCPFVRTLGVRINFQDYTAEEQHRIFAAERIYFPTFLYVEALSAAGKSTFPSVECHRLLGDKIKQTQVFQLAGVPVPRTRIYFGRRQARTILEDFGLPMVGKTPRGSSQGEGVWLIRNRHDLEHYLQTTRVAYIQEYIPLKRDIRVVVLGKRAVHSYWKEAVPGEFRTNIKRGGRIDRAAVPDAAVRLAQETALQCGLDHVGFDICEFQGRFLVFEANMIFGTAGLRAAGKDYRAILQEMLLNGEI
jgi:ribosomal protein S6--L-glutamate ligase